MALALQSKIEEVGVQTVVKNNVQAARTSGFGGLGQAVEVFIYERDFGKAHQVIEDFKMGG